MNEYYDTEDGFQNDYYSTNRDLDEEVQYLLVDDLITPLKNINSRYLSTSQFSTSRLELDLDTSANTDLEIQSPSYIDRMPQRIANEQNGFTKATERLQSSYDQIFRELAESVDVFHQQSPDKKHSTMKNKNTMNLNTIPETF